MLKKIANFVAWLVTRVLSKTEIYGQENILSGNVVYVCNHQSIFDAVINYYFLPQNTCFMAKKELFKFKPLGWVFSQIGVFSVDRQGIDLASVRHACKILKENDNLCIYPQGTRTDSPRVRLEQMHAGVAMIALKNSSRVVPIMYASKPGLFKKNVLYVGEQIDLSEFEGKKANSAVQKEFIEKITVTMNNLLEVKK